MSERLLKILSRGAALALLLLMIGSVYWLAIAPLIGWLSESTEQIANERRLLGRYLAIVQAQAASEDAAPAKGGSSMFWSGDTEAVILANMQTKLQAMASSRGAQLRSIRPLPKREQGRLLFGGLSIDMTGNIKSIQLTIQAIEAHAPILIIEAALLRPPQGAGRPALPELTIDAQLDVYGALRIQRAK